MIHQTTNSDKPDDPQFLTVKETAAHLRLCDKQIRRLISRGELRAHKFGRALRIGKEAIDAYVTAQRVIPVESK